MGLDEKLEEKNEKELKQFIIFEKTKGISIVALTFAYPVTSLIGQAVGGLVGYGTGLFTNDYSINEVSQETLKNFSIVGGLTFYFGFGFGYASKTSSRICKARNYLSRRS